jgi:hypothetical protein
MIKIEEQSCHERILNGDTVLRVIILIRVYPILYLIHNLFQKVPRSLIENNEEWIPLLEPNSNIIRWNKKGTGLFASSNPNSPYCELYMGQEKPSSPVSEPFRSSNDQNDLYCTTIPGADDLGSPTDMFTRFLGGYDRSSGSSSDIIKYLSSSYLNPKLRPRRFNFGDKDPTNFRSL